MDYRCRCPCEELFCADPARFPLADEQEQVMMVAEVGTVAAMLDGTISPQKVDLLTTTLRLLPGWSGMTDSEVSMMLARTGARTEQGRRWLCEVTHRIRLTALRRVAFRMAAMFCAWDGVLSEREQEYLYALACSFDFSEPETAELFEQATGWAP